MAIEFKNGSTWQLVGSDTYNALVGSPPVGLVYSEFAIADPAAWSYLEPILEENSGWSLCITTPRGRNHAYKFYEAGKTDKEWFAERLPATDTKVFSEEQLARIKKGLIDRFGDDIGDARYRQEYLCEFSAQNIGSYFGRAIEEAETTGRIGNIPYEPRLPVFTSWDLGIGDATAIWFVQLHSKEVRCIDYLEHSGVGIDWYIKKLQERPYNYSTHFVPHDAQVRELGTGKSRLEVMRSLGMKDIRVIPAQSVQDGLNAIYMTLPTCWFDQQKTKRGLECLQNYRRVYDEKRGTFSDVPYHDWSSHGVDAFRMLCLANPKTKRDKPIKYSNDGIV